MPISNISGVVAKTEDAGTTVFNNSDNMIEGLRLDYDGGFQSQSSVGIVEWDFDSAAAQVDIPRSPDFGGNVIDADYPFVGNGFTATTSGHLVPEYRVIGNVTPPANAKLFSLDQAGNKSLVAVYENGVWTRVP